MKNGNYYFTYGLIVPLLVALFAAVSDMFTKKAMKSINEYTALWIRYFIGFILLLVLLFFYDIGLLAVRL